MTNPKLLMTLMTNDLNDLRGSFWGEASYWHLPLLYYIKEVEPHGFTSFLLIILL